MLSVTPGVVDTDMQERIRASAPEDFPEVARFHELRRTGHFNSPAWVADHLVALALGTDGPADEVVVRIPDEAR